MFSEITDHMFRRMRYLEKLDAEDRMSDKFVLQRLRQIPPQTGRFLALMAANCPQGNFVEIGTSAGYSTMWISLAAQERNIRIKTFEVLTEKARMAGETFAQAHIEQYVEPITGDALSYLSGIREIAFCFLDAEKDVYEKCWDIIADNIVRHGILIADNALSHDTELGPMLKKVEADTRFDSLIVPIGNGELVCRRK
ncbi:MAG: class I SAM-dependent methyltransferase [Spirochaetales bacterium]|nr:class I SAM-dependent methyltransferase [Spirochaetales bacterium]